MGRIKDGMKQCSKCNQWLEATQENFVLVKKQGLTSPCKACRKARNALYRETHREEIRAHSRAVYHVDVEKSREYNRQKGSQLRYREMKRNWARVHPEVRKTARVKYRSLPENREKERVASRIWRQCNKDRRRIYVQNRHARFRAARGTLTPRDVALKLKHQRNKCYYCGTPCKAKYHIEHVVPLTRGGTNTPDNTVIACPPCNWRKNNKLPHEWPEGGRLL